MLMFQGIYPFFLNITTQRPRNKNVSTLVVQFPLQAEWFCVVPKEVETFCNLKRPSIPSKSNTTNTNSIISQITPWPLTMKTIDQITFKIKKIIAVLCFVCLSAQAYPKQSEK